MRLSVLNGFKSVALTRKVMMAATVFGNTGKHQLIAADELILPNPLIYAAWIKSLQPQSAQAGHLVHSAP